jgi:AcrR family transcriptional regulator
MTRDLKDYRSGAQKLLITAERLFGERGLDAVSLRQVAVAAGHANNSAVQHHFRSKEGLILAVFQMRLPILERAQQQWLDEIEKRGTPTFEDNLAAILMPVVYALKEPTRTTFAMFGLRLMDGDLAERTMSAQFAPVSAKIAARLQAQLPGLSPGVFDVRYRFAVRLFLNGFIELKRMRQSRNSPYSTEDLFWDDVFQSSVAAFTSDFPPSKLRTVRLGIAEKAHRPARATTRGVRHRARPAGRPKLR